MINLTRIKLNIENINKNNLTNLKYDTQSEDANLYYSKIYSNTVLKYNMTYIMKNNQKKTFTKYFILADIVNQETNTYEIIDEISSAVVLEKIGFIKYIVFKNEDLKTIFNSQATDDEKESVVTSLNRISPDQFVKIDKLAKNYFFKSLQTNKNSSRFLNNINSSVTYRKNIVFEKIFNIVGKNLKRKQINKVNKIDSSVGYKLKVSSDIQNKSQKLYNSNKSIFKNNNVLASSSRSLSEKISQTNLNAILDYNYVNCENYFCNSTLNFNFKSNNNFIKIEKHINSNEYLAEVDIKKYVENVENISAVKAYRNINIEFYENNFKETIYKTFNNKILIDSDFIFVEKLKNLKLEEDKIVIINSESRQTCNFNKEFYSRALRIWGIKNVDNDKILSNTNKNSLFIKNIIERYVIVIEEKNQEKFICFNNIIRRKKENNSGKRELFLNVNETSNLKPNILIEK